MRRGFAAVMLLLLAIVHAPGSAQALVFSLFPEFLTFGAHEPMVLLVTGAAPCPQNLKEAAPGGGGYFAAE